MAVRHRLIERSVSDVGAVLADGTRDGDGALGPGLRRGAWQEVSASAHPGGGVHGANAPCALRPASRVSRGPDPWPATGGFRAVRSAQSTAPESDPRYRRVMR